MAVTFVLLLAFAIAGSAGGAKGGKADKVPPSTPTNVRVESASTTSVSLTWDASADDRTGVAGYYVFVNGQRARVENTAYTARDLPCGEGVGVQVVAYDRVNNRSEAAATIVSTAPCPDVQPPSMPEGFVQAATTQDAIVLKWKPSTDNVGVVGYGVYRNLARVASPAEPTVTLSGLACGVTHAYQVDAVDAAGNRSHFATAYIETSSCGDSQPPSAPTGLATTSRTATSISVAWSPATDDVAVAGYDVAVTGKPAISVTQTSATLSALTCDTAYAIAVRAFDAAGNRSPASTIDSATGPCASPSPTPPADTTAPSAPTGLAASNVSQTSLTLSWSPSSDNVGVIAYDVSRNGTKTVTVASTSSNQTALTCGTSYTFAVVARDAAGNSSQAAQLNVSTAACSSPSPPQPPADTTAPSAPTGLAASNVSQTSLTLSWSPSSDNVGV
ncbi:MAG: fibronectin type III domain-containing protein, partial [Gaiellaceae bacterium]